MEVVLKNRVLILENKENTRNLLLEFNDIIGCVFDSVNVHGLRAILPSTINFTYEFLVDYMLIKQQIHNCPGNIVIIVKY